MKEKKIKRKTISDIISGMTKDDVVRCLDSNAHCTKGIGGETGVLQIENNQVFYKKIALTSVELESNNRFSTRNLHKLPLYYQYGVGSTGFGAWRELESWRQGQEISISRVRCFPRLYGFKIIEETPKSTLTTEEQKKIDDDCKYWNNSTEIKNRLEALLLSKSYLLIFIEYLPSNLYDWLGEKMNSGLEEGMKACSFVSNAIPQITLALSQANFNHFDAHFWNILTDGKQLFVGDQGLALLEDFEIGSAERSFLKQHKSYDEACLRLNLVHAIVSHHSGKDHWIRFIENEGKGFDPGPYQEVLSPHLKLARIMHRFFTSLKKNKLAKYPEELVSRNVDS